LQAIKLLIVKLLRYGINEISLQITEQFRQKCEHPAFCVTFFFIPPHPLSGHEVVTGKAIAGEWKKYCDGILFAFFTTSWYND
jgi:hypothetical protein